MELTAKDAKEFSKIMLGMADNFRDKISPEGMKMRFEMLKKYTLQQIEMAAKTLLMTRRYTKMPTVADFVVLISGKEETVEDRAQVEANNVIAHLQRYGSDTPLKTTDPVTEHLMKTRWPYREWGSRVLTKEFTWFVKDFCNAYTAYFRQAALRLPEIEAPDQLKQLSENIFKSI